MNRSPISLAVVAACLLFGTTYLLTSVTAQSPDCTNCTPPPNNGSVATAQASSWPAGTTVTVYIDPAFSQRGSSSNQGCI